MEYSGLAPDDLDNVRALNAAWLRSGHGGAPPLSAAGVERLASTPFLLFTLQEHDEHRWERLLAAPRQRDLLNDREAPSDEKRSLQAAGIAFLWELSRRNPYAARVVSDAANGWCRLITSVTLVQLLEFTADHDLIAPRVDPDSDVQRRLLQSGGSKPRELREAVQFSALQAMLTASRSGHHTSLRAAACRARAPLREVADEV